MKWQIRIQDPSGERRTLPISGTMVLGRDAGSSIQLKDTTVPMRAATLQQAALGEDPSDALPFPESWASPFWLRVAENAPSCRLGGLSLREFHLPAGIPISLGETTLALEPVQPGLALPESPVNVRPWLTESESGKKTLWMLKKAAETPLSVYLGGETGTGKEVLAHLLHAWSNRAAGAFVPLHCGALALSLAESELFGHVKGAFTGAIHHRPGALMQAHGGTLFLDEIGDLPMDIQVKLLRFLENGEIRPVGADRTSKADVRIVCATHHSLLDLVEEGRFRRDLYYRLASVTIDIPSLRSRPEDIRMLSRKFSSELNRTLSPQATLRLQAHSWPGNVRELRHAIERACGLAGPFSPVLGEEAFEFLLTPRNIAENPEVELGSSALSLKEMEKILLLKALRISEGNRTRAAKILGVARSTLFEMLKRHKIPGPKTLARCREP